MPYKTPELTISPTVLEWARKTAGYAQEDIAGRLGVSRELVEIWEKGSAQVPLRVTQLEDLAHFLKRPLATFLLADPPQNLHYHKISGEQPVNLVLFLQSLD